MGSTEERHPTETAHLGQEVPSQLGPEEQELIAEPREGKEDRKFRRERTAFFFFLRTAFLKDHRCVYSIGLRAECRRSGNRVEGKVESHEAGEVIGD